MSDAMDALALLGAEPAFASPLHVNRPGLGDRARFLAGVEEMLASRWFTNDGPNVAELEQAIARRLGVRHCVATCNGTVALQLALRAAGVTGEVLLPAFTFIATAHAVGWEGLRPVFCDIDPDSWTLDPQACAEAITPGTGAILGVHLFGRPCDTAGLAQVAADAGVPLFFDAAHAFGVQHGGRAVGGFGRAEVFSFHATKSFHAFEGGAVATDDDELADAVRLMRNFGFAGEDRVECLGLNAKMPEVCAVMGLSNLGALEQTRAGAEAVFEAYAGGLGAVPGLVLRGSSEPSGNRHYVVLEVGAAEFGLTRDELLTVLRAEGVLARRYFHPGCHLQEPYRTRDPQAADRLPNTASAAARVLVLPGGAAMTPEAAATVCRIVRAAAAQPAAVRAECAARNQARGRTDQASA